jgi:hypothetical protein
MRSYIIIISSSLILIGCSVKNNIVGKYMSKHNPNYFQLRKDSTFIYEYRALHLYQQSIGTWHNTNKSLVILNSEIKSTGIHLKVNATNGNSRDNTISLILNIRGGKSLADYKCRIYVNDEIYDLKRCDSLSSLAIKSPINSIYFMLIKAPRLVTSTYIALPLTTDKYRPNAETGNRLEITADLNDDYFYYKAFNNDTLKIKGNAIKMFNTYNGKWEKILKVPDATNLFSRYNDKSAELNKFR